MNTRVYLCGAAIFGVISTAVAVSPAMADDAAIKYSGDITVDLIGAVSGGSTHRLREVDLEEITGEADLEKLMGWKGGTASITLQNTSGGKPNNDVGTAQGIDNNEVGIRRARIFEAWVEQAIGDNASVRAGLMDLNGEFYVNDASGLLLSPQSGLASELAATGPGGPSTFPEGSGLGLRLALKPTKGTYFQAALFNADVGDPGDKGGVDTAFDLGVIEIAEGGWTAEGKGKLGFGAWRYSKAQDDLFDTDGLGHPVPRTSSGFYMVAEKVLIDGGDKGRTTTGFLRGGVSDGNTGPFKSSWNVGVLVDHALMSRPDSQVSVGLDQVTFGDSYRSAAGPSAGASETHFEVTYADKLSEHFSIQPDIQYVMNPGGVRGARNAVVAMMRLTASF